MINFLQCINEVLNEDNVSGGSGSAFGSGVTSTSTQFSGDNYAPGDARRPSVLGGKVKVIKRNPIKDSIFLGKKKKK